LSVAIKLSAKDTKAFVAALEAPPKPNPRLRALMMRPPVWQKQVVFDGDAGVDDFPHLCNRRPNCAMCKWINRRRFRAPGLVQIDGGTV
jgi:hypothetical protein